MAVKGILNLFIGEDDSGNPLYTSIYPKTTIDQVEGLQKHIEKRIEINIDAIPSASKANQGTVSIGDNISVNNGKIYIQNTDIFSALGYVPVQRGKSADSTLFADALTHSQLINGMPFDGTSRISNYTICNTPSGEKEKIADLDNFALAKGSFIIVTFTNKNEINSPLLNVNNTGGKLVCYHNKAFSDFEANATYLIAYDGVFYQLVGDINTHLIYGVKGNDENEYRTGYVNIDKTHIGLHKVDNTSDAEKWVNKANIAIADEYDNRIAYTYFTNAEAEVLAEEVLEKDNELKRNIKDLSDKYSSTNTTIADLRVDVVNNTNNINVNTKNINTLIDKNENVTNLAAENENRINSIFDELIYVHEDIVSAHDVGAQGLSTATSIAEQLIVTNNKVDAAQKTADEAVRLVGEVDRVAEIAEKDKNGNPIHLTYAPLSGPIFTGVPEAPTLSIDNDSNAIATTAFVKRAIDLITNLDPIILQTITDLKKILDENPSIKESIINSLSTKQDKSEILTKLNNLSYSKDKFIYTTGKDTFDTATVSPFARSYLSKDNAESTREVLNVLGKNEKAASAISADTAIHCIGNSLTANMLAVGKEIAITDGTNKGKGTVFDGTVKIELELPKKIIAELNGIADSARKLDNAKTIQVNLSSSIATAFTNENNIEPGVTGILSTEHGGTGKNNLSQVRVGEAEKVNVEAENAEDVVFLTAKDDFCRIRMGRSEKTDRSFIELATADKATEEIYVRQYYGKFDTINKELTLLDSNGNTNIPGVLTTNTLVIPDKKPDEFINNALWIENNELHAYINNREYILNRV